MTSAFTYVCKPNLPARLAYISYAIWLFPRCLGLQVIDCEKQPEGCASGGEAESVFDVEKEKLVHSLFQLLRATAGTGVHGRNESAPRPPNLAEYLAM